MFFKIPVSDGQVEKGKRKQKWEAKDLSKTEKSSTEISDNSLTVPFS